MSASLKTGEHDLPKITKEEVRYYSLLVNWKFEVIMANLLGTLGYFTILSINPIYLFCLLTWRTEIVK